MIDIPKIHNNIIYKTTPSQVEVSHAVSDKSKHEKNEIERRKQHNRRRMKAQSNKPLIERRLSQDRRGPSFQAKV